ncbi:serine hydrolase domain-containing protein [Rhizosphaericola mali]|uniref:Beta-lactamase family protein n=1 Tax=Rhizosphaericola mali TaxID=2545455 RepID=A0A5P2GFL7_9BACT|nr:serine hydrolase domain-containing protein [Rhizosphaericola mali]QES90421.1 beta-lactamase family protein [Rhizosphaericola mali]
MKKIILILNFLIILCFKTLFAQREEIDSLNYKLTQAFINTKIPGFTVVITNRKGIVYEKSWGFADNYKRISYTTETVENIGSVSKTFIAVALMKAIELGYFTLETNINDILPFKVINPNFPNIPITIKQLSTHTSSIIDNDSVYHKSYKFTITDSTNQKAYSILRENGYTGGLRDTSLETFLQNYLNIKGEIYNSRNFYKSKPGERYNYSNIASALAAYLIEIKAGISFANFTKKYILHPLKMYNSGWYLSDVNMKKHALPYLDLDSSLPFYSLTTYPDGGLITSAQELSKYEIEMINSLNGNSKILSDSSVKLMFSPAFYPNTSPENLNTSTRTKGIFWNLYTDGFIGHDGDDPGVSTNILFNKNCGIIFMTNMYIEDRSKFITPLKEYANKIAQ